MLETTGMRRFTQGPYPEQRLNACELYCFFLTFTIGYSIFINYTINSRMAQQKN